MTFKAATAKSKRFTHFLFLGIALIFFIVPVFPQMGDSEVPTGYKIVVAGEQYKKNKGYP